MTPDQALEAAAVLTAFANGRKIQSKHKRNDTWILCENPSWDFFGYDYRVATEPWEGKIWVHLDGQIREPRVLDDAAEARARGWRLIAAKEVQP